MRHSLNYGLLNLVDLPDEKIKAALPKAALAELEKSGGRKNHPASFLTKQLIEGLPAGSEFTVNDISVLMHQGQDQIIVKMSTLRSVLSTLARQEKSTFKVAASNGKHRLYKKV